MWVRVRVRVRLLYGKRKNRDSAIFFDVMQEKSDALLAVEEGQETHHTAQTLTLTKLWAMQTKKYATFTGDRSSFSNIANACNYYNAW